ncbi:TPA: hypothetical protein N0F65_011929 [Lagenidium giganteum]|uniref:BED-type domain-containing protein n=1 Tax=Lagenidium giganteum TaxID=4803 RepID=A0AAV2YUG7_9STRA|nr:TPA: hypothetical protein N0F65_011929 [Lagenidium giganteum]
MLSSLSSRDLIRTLFRRDGELYWCKLCPKSRKQQEGSGYTNLMDHLRRAHLEKYLLEFQLLRRVVMGGLPLNICEKPLTVNNTSLKPISTITLKKHLLAVERAVRDDVRALLHGKRLGILFDAWTEGGMHVVGVIAVTAVSPTMLCCSTLANGDDMGSDSMIDLLDSVLDAYGIDATNLCFFVCDHASVIVAVAKKTGVPMIGCASHRFNLALRLYMQTDESTITKVRQLMVRLSTVKQRHRLKQAGALMPVLDQDTR